jgi:hypothetical protein
MGKRLAILGAIIVVVALVIGAVSPAWGSSSHGSASTSSGNEDQQAISALAVFTEFDPSIDLGAPGFSLGDEVVFSGNPAQHGRKWAASAWCAPSYPCRTRTG